VCSGALLLRLLDSYAVRYSEMLDGRSEHLPTSELAGGARIRHIFQDIFVRGLNELDPSRWEQHWYLVMLCADGSVS
jgi:dynamin 1-like protein